MGPFDKAELREIALTMLEAQQEAAEIHQLKKMQRAAPANAQIYRPSFWQRMTYSQSLGLTLRVLEALAMGAIAVRLWWF